MTANSRKPVTHGRHSTYASGCRCNECKEAHRVYELNMSRERRREKLGIEARPVRMVNARNARIHLLFLGQKKIGLRTISERSGVAVSRLLRIRQGKCDQIRKNTSDRILGVAAIDPHPYSWVPAGEAKQLVKDLVDIGFKKTEIAEMLGAKPGSHINIKKNIRVERLERLRKIHKNLMPKEAL